ncbi:histidine kinase dimerization/phosphoacceptor domain -containing protein [Mucilaginibacter sp. OK098]|uniref:tetratricopeptide repeat-containing sensor histidine kinase n=1 Tax=Mucilaginibacter sp. OK098 TaxID=1855297 RepID=UPI00116149A1|nr:histidine kinase dimerization/phosphoacceptor domain -containing protein [Mucilaginibacter sp. OK098]
METRQRKIANIKNKTVHSRLLAIVCFLLFALPCQANSIPIDSTQLLKKELLRKQPDSLRVKSMIHLSNYLINKPDATNKQLDSAKSLMNTGIVLAKKIRSLSLELKCRQTLLTNKLIFSKDTTGAAQGYNALIETFHQANDLEGEADCWKDHGMILRELTKDFRGAVSCNVKAELLYQKLSNNYGVANARKAISIILTKEGRLTEAADELSKAYRYFKEAGRGFEKISCEIELASLYWKMGNTQQALYFNSEALKSAKMINDDRLIAVATNSLGRQFYNLEMYAEALPYLEGSLASTRKTKSQSDYSIALLCVIDDRVKLKSTAGLLQYLIKADRAMPSVKDIDRINIYCSYGLVYSNIGLPDKAEIWFLKMMSTFDTLEKKKTFGNNAHLFLQTYNKTIGDFYIGAHRFEKARPYFEKVLALPKKFISPASESDVHLALYRIDSASGNYISGIRHLQKYHRLHESLFNASSANQIAGLKARYAEDQRSKDLVILKSQQRAQSVLVQNTKLERNITLGGIAAILILACLAYWAYRKKQKINRHLEFQKEKIDHQNVSLKSLLEDKDLLLAEKEILLTEKDWLLKEVHHRVKNNLQVITGLLNFQTSSTSKAEVLDAIKISRNRIQAISLIHLKLSNGNNLASLNMQSYVSELISHLRDVFDLPAQFIIFNKNIEPIDIDLKQAVPIGLILNEAITNSIKYAFDKKGGAISLGLKLIDEQTLLLEIADNGKGIPDDLDPFKTESLGFKIMRGLSAQLKGNFQLESNPGTRIAIRFPLRIAKKFKNFNIDRVNSN